MQEQLRALEQRWGLALQSAHFGVWDLDPVAHQVLYSPQWKEALGYAPDPGPDDTSVWRARVHPDDLPAMLAALQAHQAGQTATYEAEFRLRDAAGDYRWVLSRGSVVARSAEGQALRLVGTLTDLTDRREAEALRQSRDRAEAANEAKSMLLSRFSHELRTPLNAILGFTQLLRLRGATDAVPEAADYLGLIEDAGWQLLRMVDQVLELSALQSPAASPEVVVVPLVDWLRVWCAAQVGSAPAWAAPAGDERLVRAAPRRLSQLLMLLGTACARLEPAARTLRSSVHPADRHVVVRLHDPALAVAPEQVQALFEPFHRLPGQGTAGLGIDLALAKSLAQWMGGDLRAEAAEGGGTRFLLELPLSLPET